MSDAIFDIDNLNDVSQEIKEQLRKKRKIADSILNLFKIKNQLSIDEIIVGLYRKYKLAPNRLSIANQLYRLHKDGLIKKVHGAKGIYALYKS